MLRIEAVKEEGPARESGLRKGDAIVSVGSRPVRDVIDFFYHSHERNVKVVARRGTREFSARLNRDASGIFGLRFAPFRPFICSNKCVFCFVDQLPPGLRRTLYVKDEDYRLSFLQGSFITMTNLGASSIERIVRQRLSPLYVSVHATNPGVRGRMLGIRAGAEIIPKLEALKKGRIRVHAQIVLCPGVNDEAELERTVEELSALHPCVQSVAIVPVGLTRFRKGLLPLKPVDGPLSHAILGKLEKWQRTFLEKHGTRFVFAADEFYQLAGIECPAARKYEGFPQLENGVGMVRVFEQQARRLKMRLKAKAKGKPIAVLTGRLSEKVCSGRLADRGIKVIGIENEFFGRSITVTGLLTGRDILRALRRLPPGEVAVVSETCVNEDGLFLDGFTPERLEELSNHKLIIEGIGDAECGRGNNGTAKRRKVHAFQ